MKRSNIITIILCCAIALTSVFSVSRVNANTIYTNFTDSYVTKIFANNYITGSNSCISSKSLTLTHGVSNISSSVPMYAGTPEFTKYDYHTIGSSTSTVIAPKDRLCNLTIGNIRNLTYVEFWDEGATGQQGQSVYSDEIEFYPSSITYRLYYTDGTSSSSTSISLSNYTQSSADTYNPYTLYLSFTPTKDVWKVYVTISFKCLDTEELISLFNRIYYTYGKTDCYFDVEPYYGSSSPVIQFDIEDRSTTLLDSINNFISNIKTNVSNTLTNLTNGFTNVLTRLNEVKSGIADKIDDLLSGLGDKLGTVGDNIVTMKDNLLTRLTEVKSGIVDKLVTVGDSITTMKDNLLTRLNEVKSGIVDGITNYFDFTSTSEDLINGEEALDEVLREHNPNSILLPENHSAPNFEDYVPSDNVGYIPLLSSITEQSFVKGGLVVSVVVAFVGYIFFGKR